MEPKKKLNDIDDIFASKKTKAKNILPTAEKKTSKHKKPKNDTPSQSSSYLEPPKAPVINPSAPLVVDFTENPHEKSSKTIQSSKSAADDDFADSRGKNNKRKKIDGLNVYDISEMNIGKGGDTEDCPFDCQCCF